MKNQDLTQFGDPYRKEALLLNRVDGRISSHENLKSILGNFAHGFRRVAGLALGETESYRRER